MIVSLGSFEGGNVFNSRPAVKVAPAVQSGVPLSSSREAWATVWAAELPPPPPPPPLAPPPPPPNAAPVYVIPTALPSRAFTTLPASSSFLPQKVAAPPPQLVVQTPRLAMVAPTTPWTDPAPTVAPDLGVGRTLPADLMPLVFPGTARPAAPAAPAFTIAGHPVTLPMVAVAALAVGALYLLVLHKGPAASAA